MGATVSSDLPVASVYTMYDAWFQQAYNAYEGPDFMRLVTPITLGDHQGDRIDLNWLGAAPQLREWLDEKRPKGFNVGDLQLIVRNFEATIEIDKNAIRDGKWGLYESRIREMAMNARRHPWQLISALIRANTSGGAWDGQDFFDTDHSHGASGTVSNLEAGSGTSAAQIQTDWFAATRRMREVLDDQGNPIGVAPDLAVIPAELEEPFALLKAAAMGNKLGGNSTLHVGDRFDYIVDPLLTDANDWYAFYTGGAIKPFIWLEREAPHPVNLIDPETSVEAFMRRRLFYSVEARREAGYGMWWYAQKITN